jgi:hypothetical protein
MNQLIMTVFRFLVFTALGMPVVFSQQNVGADKAGGNSGTTDIWAPWRKASNLTLLPYQAGAEPAKVYPFGPVKGVAATKTAVFPKNEGVLPLRINLSNFSYTETDGIEVSFRFRVQRIPSAKLDASHSLAKFALKGKNGSRGFWLHAYSGNSGFCLNGIVPSKKDSTVKILLCRGAANPQSSPRWDTQWHTVCLAWSRGQFAATWDGLPILHATDTAAPYQELVLEWVKPAECFGTLELTPVEAKVVKFNKLP